MKIVKTQLEDSSFCAVYRTSKLLAEIPEWVCSDCPCRLCETYENLIDRWMDGWMDAQTQIDRQIDIDIDRYRQIDRQIDRQIENI